MTTLAPRPVTDAVIAPDASRFVFVELSFASRRLVPRRVVHRLRLLGAKDPGTTEATPLAYTAAPLTISRRRPPVLSPPLRGPGWVATNGCCASTVHRRSVQTVNGGFFDAQRFALDWIRMDGGGRFVDGDRPTCAATPRTAPPCTPPRPGGSSARSTGSTTRSRARCRRRAR
jgi:hypothetical protein